MRIVINGVSIDCKNRSRIQIFDGLRHVIASMEVRTLAYILERDLKRRAARKPAEYVKTGELVEGAETTAADYSGASSTLTGAPGEPPMSARGDEFPPVEPVDPGPGHPFGGVVEAVPFVNLPAALCAPVPLNVPVCPECDLRPGGSIKVRTLEAPVCMACGRVIALTSQGHE